MAEDRRHPLRQAVGSTGHSAEPGVGRQLSELARELQADLTTDALLSHIARAAVTEIPGARYAGISQVAGKEWRTTAASGELVEQVDQAQYQSGEGPCLDAARHHQTVRSDDLRAETRWPQFARRAANLGVLSAVSFQLFAGEDSFGALNVYASAPGAFANDGESTGILLASHAALAIAAARTQAGLLAALGTREVIGAAKGILMERYKITEVEAFGLLVTSSQAVNRKLRNVAEHLVVTGELLTPSR